MTDYQLAREAAAGDQLAFEALYRQHYRKVYSICLRMLRDQRDAEDAAQEVFVRVHRRVCTFQGESAFTTWLHSLTVNSVMMYLRTKRRRQWEQLTEDGVPENITDSRALWRYNEIRMIERIALKQAMAQLPTGYRHVLMLHDVEGYRHEEIGRLLGISAGTSKSQLHMARARLRKLLL